MGTALYNTFKNYAVVSNHATTPFTVSAAEVRGSVTTNLGAGASITCTLPAATVGMKITFYIDAAFALVVTPASGEQLMVLTSAANKTLTSDAVVGTYLQLACLQAAKWYPTGWSGTWTSS